MTGTRMRPIARTIPLDEAKRLIAQAIVPIDRVERVPMSQANGRVVSRNIVSEADVPPFSRAGMDGYAVRAVDTAGASRTTPRTLTRIGTVFTGEVPAVAVGSGECVEIATGAPMPPGANAVVMVEETHRTGYAVSIFAAVNEAQNVGRQGADISAGAIVLCDGDLLNASRIGAVAALGLRDIEVYARPRVAILSTGNEIVEPGQRLAPGQIYDVNRYTLSALVEEHGGTAEIGRAHV